MNMQWRHRLRRRLVRSFAVIWVVLALNFIVLTCIAGAQTNTATLSGTVMDSAGAVVPNVAITVSSKATGLKRQATTNKEGLFTLPLLPPEYIRFRHSAKGSRLQRSRTSNCR